MNKEATHWGTVEKALAEESPTGYIVACLEARKNFILSLKNNNIPVDNLQTTLRLFSWKFSNPEEVKKALEVCENIINNLDYKLSTFEAEDVIESFKVAIMDLADKSKKITWQKKIIFMVTKSDSENRFKFRKILIYFLFAITLIKVLTSTSIGKGIVDISNSIFSLVGLALVASLVIAVFVLITFIFLDKKKDTKIKSIKEK